MGALASHRRKGNSVGFCYSHEGLQAMYQEANIAEQKKFMASASGS